MTLHLLALTMLAQVTAAAGPRTVMPVLAFPEPGVDDTAAYRGYQTRFYRDSKNNAVQIYLDPAGGRVVQLWADAADESVGFTVRDARGRPAQVAWDGDGARVADSGATRTLEYRLSAAGPRVTLGWFLLGSMRVERDFQYDHRQLRPFAAPAYYVAEESLLVANLARLPAAEQQRQLPLLSARSLAALRTRLQPILASSRSDTLWTVRVQRPSLDGRNHLLLELRGDPREGTARVTGRSVLVLGAGGAARGILQPLLGQRPHRVVVANRTHARAVELATRFTPYGAVASIEPRALAGSRFDIVINATSIGLNSQVPRDLWPDGMFASAALAYDLVYANQKTPFMVWAAEQGAAKTADGLGMLIEQAAESFLLWRGVRPETAPVFALLRGG